MTYPLFGAGDRDNMITAWESYVGTSPKLLAISGAAPVSAASAQSGTLLGTGTLPSDWLAAPSSGEADKAGTWTVSITVAGALGYWRLKESTNTSVRMQGVFVRAFELTTSAATAANDNILTFTSTAGITVADGVFGTGVQPGTVVLEITSTTVKLSLPVVAPAVSSGATIAFGDSAGIDRKDAIWVPTLTVSAPSTLTVDVWHLIAPGA